MSESKKCINNNCSDCQQWLKEKLFDCEDWEVKRKESYRKFELRFCPNAGGNSDKPKNDWYVETGGYNYNWENCPHCNKVIKTIKSNGQWGDSTVESEDVSHSCQIKQVNKSTSQQVNKSTSQTVGF